MSMNGPDADVEALLPAYERWTAGELAAMRAALADIRPETTIVALRRVFEGAHNLKGQGTSFGYPLMTRIGESLCRLGRRMEREGFPAEQVPAVEAHVEALSIIATHRIRGDGGTLGTTLASRLEGMV